MSIEKILEKIDREADSAVDEIISGAESEAELIGKEYRKKEKKLRERLNEESEKISREESRRLVVNEQLELRKSLLYSKRKILDDFFSEARKRVESMPEEDTVDFIEKLILNRAITGREDIVLAEEQKGLFPDNLIETLNESFSGGGSFSLGESSTDFSWGVILREGNRIVDLSLDALFSQVAEEVEPEVAALLFREKSKG